MRQFKFPTAYTILYALIVLVAVATWFVPAGEYDRHFSDAMGREVPIPGTYKRVEQHPQGLEAVALAPVAGFYDPKTYEARAIDVALFVIVIGGFLGVVTRTGAIDAGIARTMNALKGRERWMIPILMALFAAGGTIYGMAEESLAFYALIIPVMMAAGYDALVGVAIILLGAGIGTLGSTINPFATVIASNAAGVPFTNGIILRAIILGVGWLVCVIYVMRYAASVRADPHASLLSDQWNEHREHFLGNRNRGESVAFTAVQKIVLVLFVAAFGIMIWGVSAGGWWMAEMTALFLVMSIVVGLVAWMGEEEFTSTFVSGARDLLGVALVIGLARGIVVVMDAGKITDTILFWAESSVRGLSKVYFINAMYWVQVALSFFVPSSSGLAVLSMPIMAPLAEFSGVRPDLAVTAYQSANGLVNLFNPTFAVVMGGLAIGKIPYNVWLRFVWPLLLILTVLLMLALSIGTMTQ